MENKHLLQWSKVLSPTFDRCTCRSKVGPGLSTAVHKNSFFFKIDTLILTYTSGRSKVSWHLSTVLSSVLNIGPYRPIYQFSRPADIPIFSAFSADMLINLTDICRYSLFTKSIFKTLTIRMKKVWGSPTFLLGHVIWKSGPPCHCNSSTK